MLELLNLMRNWISKMLPKFCKNKFSGNTIEQADFAMSKIASYEPCFDNLFGVNLRKCIDYFSHLAKEPHFFAEIEKNDLEFKATEYLQKYNG